MKTFVVGLLAGCLMRFKAENGETPVADIELPDRETIVVALAGTGGRYRMTVEEITDAG